MTCYDPDNRKDAHVMFEKLEVSMLESLATLELNG